ncbi:hypothetical protein [Cellulomonas endophytica]|uniref:hypothetical protein n=1 Tax=Cellulomonas endophytica TaxID=2494735 RepID=UPI0010131DF2|nr:hypothetical protein [Cellulomonas endophytica]
MDGSARWTAALVGALGIGGASVAATRAVQKARPRPRPDRWHAVTVDRAPADLQGVAAAPPEPLAALGDDLEIDLRPAPGDRGTELRARARRPGLLVDADVRDALRRSRSLLEVGEVVQPDEPGTTRRTVTSLPLELAIRHGREGGRL